MGYRCPAKSCLRTVDSLLYYSQDFLLAGICTDKRCYTIFNFFSTMLAILRYESDKIFAYRKQHTEVICMRK